MGQLLVILSYKLLGGLKRVLAVRRKAFARDLASFVILIGFSAAIFLFARVVTQYLLSEARIGLFLYHRFVSMVLFVFFLAINLGNMIVAYSTLYKSDEVDFLLTQPISFGKIFTLKFLDTFFHSSSTLLLVGGAIVAGYASFFNLPWWLYVAVVLGMVIPFMLLAAALAVMILFGLVTLADKISIRRLIGGVLLVYLASVYLYFRFTNPMQLTEQVMKFYPNVNAYYGQFDPAFVPYLPSHWLADALYFIVRGEASVALPYVVVLLLVTSGALLLCAFLGGRLYYKTWLVAQRMRLQRLERRAGPARFFDFQRASALQPQTEVLLKKDYWQFFRESSQWLHLLVLLFLMLVFIVSMSNLELKTTIPFLQTVSYLVVMTFNGFLIASVALRFIFPILSLEGQSFWAVRSAPVRLRKIYWMKFRIGLTLVLLIALLLSLLSNFSLRSHEPLMMSALLSALTLGVGLVALNLGAGAYFVDYREKSPIRIASSEGASLTFLLSLAYLILVVSIFFMPVHQYFEHIIFHREYSSTGLSIAVAFALTSTLVVVLGATLVGARSFEKDFV
jgi:ABC-2 type transport system permease protein